MLNFNNNSTVTTIYLVRHGETEGNVKKILQGHIDTSLTKKGIDQAEKLKVMLASVKFDLIFSSTLKRARDTAKILSKPHGLKLFTSKLLKEIYFGKYEGMGWEKFDSIHREIKKKRDKYSKIQRMSEQLSPEIESDDNASERVRKFLLKTAKNHPAKTMLVVSHGAVMKALLIKLGWANYQDFTHDSIENCSYILFKSDGDKLWVVDTHGIKKITTVSKC